MEFQFIEITKHYDFEKILYRSDKVTPQWRCRECWLKDGPPEFVFSFAERKIRHEFYTRFLT